MAGELIRVTITRNDDGTWDTLRERADNGERFNGARNMVAAFDAVLRAYHEDGTPRNKLPDDTERQSKGSDE